TCYEPGLRNITRENQASINLGTTPFAFSNVNKFNYSPGVMSLPLIAGSDGRNFTSGCVSLCLQQL
ncbi:wall-associated receptor kinase 2, partial [Phtheirospermum japonicum]